MSRTELTSDLRRSLLAESIACLLMTTNPELTPNDARAYARLVLRLVEPAGLPVRVGLDKSARKLAALVSAEEYRLLSKERQQAHRIQAGECVSAFLGHLADVPIMVDNAVYPPLDVFGFKEKNWNGQPDR